MKKKRTSQNGFFNSRVLLGFLLGSMGVLLALSGFAIASGTSAQDRARASQTPEGKIAPEVLTDTSEGKSASVVILLADQADVSAAYAMKDQDARGWFVYNTLSQHAARTQADLQTFLTSKGVSYQSFWVANMIVATANRTVVESLAARADVARINANRPFRGIEDPAVADFQPAPESPDVVTAIEWGVSNVNAPAVWGQGFNGQGMVIGDLDTGMRWTHSALKPKYRGWNGTTADHNFNWHDAVHSGGGACGANTVAPCDDSGHGTHTAGTTVGESGTNQIGVAPGAKWIGCRNMNVGVGTPATYTECFQFMIAPTDLSGNNANPTLRPHVINNSWGCPVSEGCVTGAELETIVNNTQAAGIFVTVSAGNSGPNCETVEDAPAMYSASFSVGAISITNGLANFSSRGPSTFYTPNLLKPNISAPGASVRSSYFNSDTSYANLSGTSMAGPHVVGVIALLWSAHPELVRDIDATKTLLQNTANPNVTLSAQTCGGTPSTQIPNNSFGYGRVDALNAANLGATPTPTPPSTPTPTPPASPSPTAPPPSPTPSSTPGGPTPTPTAAQPTPTPAAQSINLSTRVRVQGGDNVGIGGFIITGTAPKHVLLRAIGPSLASLGVPDVLADPVLELHGPSGFTTITNNNWRDDPLQEPLIIATGIPPASNLEAAIDATLTPGAYTAIVLGNGDTSGVALVELYDLSQAVPGKLANISTRAFVDAGDNIVIAGFMLGNQGGSDRVVIRGLAAVGVPSPLADPRLELRDVNGALIASDNNWQDDSAQAAQLSAVGLAPSSNLDAAIIATLQPGPYTALLLGNGGTTGVGLVEVYDLGAP
jgi:subtilisin family serine protease